MSELPTSTDTRDAPRPGRKTTRTREPRESAIADRIVLGQFWRNRRRDESVVVSIEPFEGLILISIRIHVVDTAGKMLPTKKGISLRVDQLPELTRYLLRAEDRAKELGLIGGGA